jgi:hypothetical protein
MTIRVKLSDMDSCLIGTECGTDRPSQLSSEGITSMEYLSSLADLATRIVRQQTSVLPPARGEWDYIRALLTQMIDGEEGQTARRLLSRKGIRCIPKPSERDRFWFTIPGCSKPVHVVARPTTAPPTPAEVVKVQGELELNGLVEAEHGTGRRLFMLCEKDRGGLGLASVTLALVSNPQARWIVDGVNIVDEVVVFLGSTALTRPASPLSDEDEGVFRAAMTRRDLPVADIDLDSFEGEGVEPAAEPKRMGDLGV